MNREKYINNISNYIEEKPKVGIILGSGLGIFSSAINESINIDYNSIKDYPNTTVSGHKGRFIIGNIHNKSVICADGRFHYYEGYDIKTTTLPVEIFNALGCQNIIITNAAGCINNKWELGSFMLINKCMDFTYKEKKIATIDNIINYKIKKNIINNARKTKITLNEGTYGWTQGPNYETPAEINAIKKLGADAVGMSTMPEIVKSLEYNLNVIGISCLSNYASGIKENILRHKDVISIVEKAKNTFITLLVQIIKNL